VDRLQSRYMNLLTSGVRKYLTPRNCVRFGLSKLGYFQVWRNLLRQVEAARRCWTAGGDGEMVRLRARTLEFVARCKRPEDGEGRYAFKPKGPSLAYASCYAALTLHLYGALDDLAQSDRQGWVNHLKSFQDEDGLFRDPLVACPAAEELDWWGWRHLTLHVLMALHALGAVAERPFTVLREFRQRGAMRRWLENRPWHEDAPGVSNQVQNYATMLQYSRDFQEERWCHDALDEMFTWLDRTQDPSTGLWGTRFDTPHWLSQGVQTGYHLWLLYFYDRRRIQYPECIIDSCLATQNRLGGFGAALNSSACEDIDSIDPMVRLGKVHDHRGGEVRGALEQALYWVLANFNGSGGAVFRRYEELRYGHYLMSARPEEPSLFPTWFRTLGLAYLGQSLPETAIGRYPWRFLSGPGYQFYFAAEETE